jgi:hypothetical protein
MPRVSLVVALLLLGSCTLRHGIPNGQLACADDRGCPQGYVCDPAKLVCCLHGDCTANAGRAPGESDPDVNGRTGGGPFADRDGGAPPDGKTSPVSTGGTGGGASSTGGSSGTGGGGAVEVCPAPCPLRLLDHGLDERDLATQCAGQLCVTGGLAP